MLKFTLLVLSSFIAMVAAAHTVSFLFAGQYLLAAATSVFFIAGCNMAVEMTQLGRTPRSSSSVVNSNEHISS